MEKNRAYVHVHVRVMTAQLVHVHVHNDVDACAADIAVTLKYEICKLFVCVREATF